MQHGRIVMQMRTMIRALALLFGLALVPSAMAQVDARLIVKFRDGATKSALTPQARISTAKEVRIEVLVSRNGVANPAPGDLTGSSGPVAPGNDRVALTIDTVRK